MAEQKQLTLIATVADILRRESHLPAGYAARPMTPSDQPGLSDLYFVSYSRDIVADLEAAGEEIARTLRGEYGQLDFQASPVVTYRGMVVGSVLTVHEAPWHDTPPGPFIIEVMVHPGHRQKGLARYAMQSAAREVARRGKGTVALRVMSDNGEALSLYSKLGFVTWNYTPPAA
jgi:ribosomal protein S18 acetylase RimI-like enzyme